MTTIEELVRQQAREELVNKVSMAFMPARELQSRHEVHMIKVCECDKCQPIPLTGIINRLEQALIARLLPKAELNAIERFVETVNAMGGPKA